MTQEEFIKVLDKKGYSYEMEGDKIVVKYFYDLWLNSLETLPHDVEFNNGGDVYLDSLKTLPPGVEFKNGGNVRLVSLKTLPQGFVFENRGSVSLEALTSLSLGVEFRNGEKAWLGDVYLESITGGWFGRWKGNIKGIASKKLLNVMIKQGVFER